MVKETIVVQHIITEPENGAGDKVVDIVSEEYEIEPASGFKAKRIVIPIEIVYNEKLYILSKRWGEHIAIYVPKRITSTKDLIARKQFVDQDDEALPF